MQKEFSDPNVKISGLIIILIIVVSIGLTAIYINRYIDSKPIKLIAEDYSRLGGTTPEEYMGITKVVHMDGLNEKYNTVYHGVARKEFDCDAYTKSRKFKNFAYCSDAGEGKTEITLFSNHLPETEIFRVTDWEIK